MRTAGASITRYARTASACVVVVAAATAAFARDVPPAPKTGAILDELGLLSSEDAAEIARIQTDALRTSNTAIAVATIRSVGDFDESNIEPLARRWFDRWGVGGGGGTNRGILLLVATGDRKARIELGADWGADWNEHAATIMDGTIVPRFKAGDFSRGIADGVRALAEMAASGPATAAPSHVARRVSNAMSAYSMFGPAMSVVLTLLGVALLVVAAIRGGDKWMWIAGIALIVVGMFTYVAILALALWSGRPRPGRPLGWFSGGGASSSGGGFFSGGSSGGGGATGSW